MFYRRQLLKAKKDWVTTYLMGGGAQAILDPRSSWSIGYAPDEQSRLVDSLRAKGFDLASVRNAGLGLLDPEGRTIDRFRDRLMLPAWNDQLEAVGFIGVRADPTPHYLTSPATQVHRRSNALVGVAEQIDLLSEGAIPVLVNSPLEALAVERLSRLTIGRWAGIPLCDTLLSAEQTRILSRYAATDTAIVVLADEAEGHRAAVEFLDDLSRFFTRVHAVLLPSGQAASSMITTPAGRQRLHDVLLTSRPLSDYRQSRTRRRPPIRIAVAEPSQPDQSPSP